MKKNLLKQPIITNLKKRKQKIFDFYYLTYGQIIKKRRLELKRTQEDVACSICSNTYISKAENNQVVIGDDQLNLIMERLDISNQAFANPEKMVHYLGSVIQYYYYRDIVNYEKLIEKLDGYHFHALVELLKLGYFILKTQLDKASRTYNQLLDYLNSIDDVAFEVFLIFSADLSLKMNQLDLAKYLIDQVYISHMDYPELKPMYLYSKFLIYGRLNFTVQMMELYHQLIIQVSNSGNTYLMNEIIVHHAIFSELNDRKVRIKYLDMLSEHVDSDLIDEFLLIKAFKSDHPKLFVNQIKQRDSHMYLTGLFLMAKAAKDNGSEEDYQSIFTDIEHHPMLNHSQIDYCKLLNLNNQQQWTFYKDYLINPCLKVAKERQSIFLIKYVSHKIANVLQENNRYKDALNYMNQAEKHIEKIKYSES